MKKIFILICTLMCFTMASAKSYMISAEGIKMIKDFEKCVLTAYPDAGSWSIGYGHHTAEVYEGMKITQAQADKYFESDIKKCAGSVKRLLSALPYEYEFSQGFIDGMFSLVYNCGEGGVKRSVFYQRLMNCRVVDGVMDESDFNFTVAGVKLTQAKTKHHIERRHKEHLMMLS
jgi:GH24 family phage-related lysozyme (muramidase)